MLRVEEEQKQWKEGGERKRRWLSVGRAAKLVQEPTLTALIKRLKRAAVKPKT